MRRDDRRKPLELTPAQRHECEALALLLELGLHHGFEFVAWRTA